MSFPAYPNYKRSSVAWLGDVPSHWSVLPLKHIVSTPITDGPHETPEFLDEGVPFVSAEAVSSGSINFDKIRGYISREDHERYSLKYLPKYNDIYMVKSGATTGVTAIVETEDEFNIWSPLAAIRCGNKAHPRFILHYLRSRNFLEGVTLNWSFGTQQNIGMQVIENLCCTLPPHQEQTAIAAFLDRETAKVDALVAEQERLIALLKEKRQAVISHAVTKGLNPDAPMKGSGIEWLGEIPAHWRQTRTSREFKLGMGQTILSETLDEAGEWPVFSATEGDHYFGRIFEPNLRLAAGDLIIPARGNSIGHVKIASEPCTTTQTTIYAQILNRNEISPDYAYWFMRGLKKWLFPFVQTAIPQITTTEIGANVILIPRMAEQLAIVDHVKGVVAQYEGLIAEAQSAITLLQERRAALISAAVTGKIDVRGVGVTTPELETA